MKDGMRENDVHGLAVPIAIAKDLLADPVPTPEPPTASEAAATDAEGEKSDATAGVSVDTVSNGYIVDAFETFAGSNISCSRRSRGLD